MAALLEPQEPGLDASGATGEPQVEPGEEPDLSERPSTRLRRDADLLGNSNSKCRAWLRNRFGAIAKGFEDQAGRSDDLDKWWNILFAILDDNQFYNGNAEVYWPAIRDALIARATRFSNQLFPQSGRYVDATTSDGTQPYEIIALVTHYIRALKLKTQVVKPLITMGDIEGTYHILMGWEETTRQIVSRETRGTDIDGVQAEGAAPHEIVDIKEEDVVIGLPTCEPIHDSDVLILPASAKNAEDALSQGGSITIVWRWSKEKRQAMIDKGEIRKGDDDDAMMISGSSTAGLSDLAKSLARSIGIRAKGQHTVALETWQMMPLNEKGAFDEDHGTMRMCRTWYDLAREPRGAKRNPYWNDRCPLLFAPVQKIAGVAKGQSQVEPIAPLQYEANDAANERADADHYSAMPIVLDGREERSTPLVLNLAAVWPAKPAEVSFAAFPDLSQRSRSRIGDAQMGINQALGVNPSMMPQQTGRQGQKRNQAEMANEQAVDLLTTAEAVDVLAEGILNDVVSWMVDLDHQFRDRDITVRMFGEMGLRAEMADVPPLKNRAGVTFTWCGAEQAKMNVAIQQQGTAFINVLRGMRQDLEAEGYHLRLGPMLERQAVNIFGGMTGSLILQDRRHELTVPPDKENQMLDDGFMVPVHPEDPDPQHLQSHHAAMRESGDPHGVYRLHMEAHMKQMQMKIAAQQQAQMQKMMQPPGGGGAPGVPGGAGPGVAGTPGQGQPQPGAQPAGPRLMRGPAGMPQPEQLPRQGAVLPPRKF